MAYAAGQDDGSAVVTTRGALELVEGPVFTYRNADRASYAWVEVGNWISTWELKVTDAAAEHASLSAISMVPSGRHVVGSMPARHTPGSPSC